MATEKLPKAYLIVDDKTLELFSARVRPDLRTSSQEPMETYLGLLELMAKNGVRIVIAESTMYELTHNLLDITPEQRKGLGELAHVNPTLEKFFDDVIQGRKENIFITPDRYSERGYTKTLKAIVTRADLNEEEKRYRVSQIDPTYQMGLNANNELFANPPDNRPVFILTATQGARRQAMHAAKINGYEHGSVNILGVLKALKSSILMNKAGFEGISASDIYREMYTQHKDLAPEDGAYIEAWDYQRRFQNLLREIVLGSREGRSAATGVTNRLNTQPHDRVSTTSGINPREELRE